MKSEHTLRTRFVFILFLLVAVLFGGRLFQLQILQGKEYTSQAGDQYVKKVPDLFTRGSIYFQTKDNTLISAATLASGYLLALDTRKLKNPQEAFEKLSPIVPLDRETFFLKAGKINDPHEELAKHLSEEKGKAILELSIPGVEVHREKWRLYPGGELAAHVLGFVGFNGDNLGGRYGVERHFEDILSRDGDETYVNFFAELFDNITHSLFSIDNGKKGDVVLTIEPTVEQHLEKTLKQVTRDWSSDTVGGIIMDPSTGRIYAMASLPTFDPNTFGEFDGNAFANPLVERVYEMGSIVKPLAMAAGLDKGVVTPDTTYEDKGFVIVDNRRIENFDGKTRGKVTMQEVLNNSMNTGMVFVAQSLGNDALRDYYYAYGVHEETGIDLPGEVRGLASNLESNRDIEYATASFGQGIAVTPIGITRSLATLGNGGRLVTPTILDRIEYPGGFSKKNYPDKGVEVISKETSEAITRMLVEVVDTALLGGTVKMEHYSIAAKTGTAQIPDPVNGGYYEDRFLHSFFGYFPAYNPKFIIFLYNVNPKGAQYASQTLTHPFIDMAQFLISYYQIPPDR